MHAHTPEQTTTFWNWFSGGSTQYMKLTHCMNHDWLWIILTVGLDLAVGVGYGLIALHWWRNQRNLQPGPPKRALGSLKNIFIFCACCGYIFIPLKMFWPAWRLYDIFMAVLVYFTWKYAWGARHLKVLYTELGKTQKLETELEVSRREGRQKSFFLNAISHDLRTPLNGLTLQADLAEMSAQSGDVEALKDALAEIKSSARATADLLDGFLELGRLDWAQDQNKVTQFELLGCIENVAAAQHERAMGKGLRISIHCPRQAVARTDRIKLERILTNLLNNAIKFTDRGGVRIDAVVSGADLVVEVTDTGRGMEPGEQEQLFEEFYQVCNHERDRAKGFGLGLAISRRLAQQLGGEIEVESQRGQGSRFRVRLPGAVATTGAGADSVQQHASEDPGQAAVAAGGR